jgi:8-oxo-dGTP pyrophosphatase MutT (NUDIX family)
MSEDRQSFYIGVKAVISQAGKVLILKDKPRSKWELPGGRIDGSQTIEESLRRELTEEIPGADLVKLGDILHAATGDFTVENNHRLCLLFYKAEVNLPDKIELSDEHTEFVWVDKSSYTEYELFSSDNAALAKAFGDIHENVSL